VTHLSGQAREFTRSLILFHNGLMSASQLTEEAHTMTVALLRACLPDNERRGSFTELLERVATAASLDPADKRTLTRLKDRRKKAKHHGQRVRHADVVSDLGDLLGALHCLFRHLRERAGVGA
jgi:hypothetical protein